MLDSSPLPLLSVWRSLTREQRGRLARDIAGEVVGRRLDKDSLQALAKALNFRVDALRRSSESALTAVILNAFPRVEPRWFGQILVQVHFGSRSQVLARVYDVMGIEHDGPSVESEVLEIPFDVDEVRSAFAEVSTDADAPDLLLCLRVMRHECSAAWRPGVDAAIEALASATVELEDSAAPLSGPSVAL